MRSLVFEGNTWSADETLRKNDPRLHQALRRLLKEMLREDPAHGSGKPEALKHHLSGLWSRRLSQKDRVIYSFDDEYVYVFAIGGHYEQIRERLTSNRGRTHCCPRQQRVRPHFRKRQRISLFAFGADVTKRHAHRCAWRFTEIRTGRRIRVYRRSTFPVAI